MDGILLPCQPQKPTKTMLQIQGFNITHVTDKHRPNGIRSATRLSPAAVQENDKRGNDLYVVRFLSLLSVLEPLN
eukprot:3824398-Amphidinium_carterae.1